MVKSSDEIVELFLASFTDANWGERGGKKFGSRWLSAKQTAWLASASSREAGRMAHTYHGNGNGYRWEMGISPINHCGCLHIIYV